MKRDRDNQDMNDSEEEEEEDEGDLLEDDEVRPDRKYTAQHHIYLYTVHIYI